MTSSLDSDGGGRSILCAQVSSVQDKHVAGGWLAQVSEQAMRGGNVLSSSRGRDRSLQQVMHDHILVRRQQ